MLINKLIQRNILNNLSQQIRNQSCVKHPNEAVTFRQLVDNNTSTFTYLVADQNTKDAILIDPVYEKVERDLKLVKDLKLNLLYAINTHIHADHVTGSGLIKKYNKNVKSMLSKDSKGKADIYLKENDVIKFGNEQLLVLATPGHTNGCLSFVSHKAKIIFTGDALLIRSCGRTDFQQGNSGTLYDSIHNKILTLPDEYIVFPGHDYNGFTSSSIGEEKRLNPRLTQTKNNFIDTMKVLNLPYPRLIDKAVPANMVCGILEDVVKS